MSQITNSRTPLKQFFHIAFQMFDKIELDMSDYAIMWEALMDKYGIRFKPNEFELGKAWDCKDYFYDAINAMSVGEREFKRIVSECMEEIPASQTQQQIIGILEPFIKEAKMVNGTMEITLNDKF